MKLKGQATTITWFVAFFIIIALLVVFIFASSTLSVSKQLNEVSYLESPNQGVFMEELNYILETETVYHGNSVSVRDLIFLWHDNKKNSIEREEIQKIIDDTVRPILEKKIENKDSNAEPYYYNPKKYFIAISYGFDISKTPLGTYGFEQQGISLQEYLDNPDAKATDSHVNLFYNEHLFYIHNLQPVSNKPFVSIMSYEGIGYYLEDSYSFNLYYKGDKINVRIYFDDLDNEA